MFPTIHAARLGGPVVNVKSLMFQVICKTFKTARNGTEYVFLGSLSFKENFISALCHHGRLLYTYDRMPVDMLFASYLYT